MAHPTNDYRIVLPAHHPGQDALARQLKRFNVVRCGRRWGKTVFGSDYLISDLGGIPGAANKYRLPFGWFAPTIKTLGDGWESMKDLLRDHIHTKHETYHWMKLWNGSVIEFWTLDVESPARGRKYAKVVIDEAAHVRDLEKKWTRSIRPTLTDYAGGALFISTPAGKNYFHKLDQYSLTRPTWASYHAPSTQNPYLPAGEIEEARLDMPDLVFRQEYMAEYVDFEGALVRPDWCRSGTPDDDLAIVLGVDLAISTKTTADWTAIVAMSRHPVYGKIYVRGALRFRGSFNEILRQIELAAERWGPVLIVVEDVQFQAAVVQELLRTTKLPVVGFTPAKKDKLGRKDKLTRFLPMAARYEQLLVYHDPNLPAEFVDEILSFTGDGSGTDDFVDAEAMAFYGIGMTMGPQVASAGHIDTQEEAMAGFAQGLQ